LDGSDFEDSVVKALREGALIGLIGVLCWALVSLTMGATHALQVVEAEARGTREGVLHQLSLTHSDLLREFELTRKDLNGQLTALQYNFAGRMDNATQIISGNLDDTNAILLSAAQHYDATAQKAVGITLEELDPLVTNLSNLTLHVDQDENQVYSRYLATTGELNKTLDAARRMAEAGAKAAPVITENVATLTTYAAGLTKPTQKPSLLHRLGSFLLPLALKTAITSAF
jgi:hypothetical protein